MYTINMITIVSKPTDLKICKKCNRPNWYENETCTHIDCDSNSFHSDGEGVQKWVDEEYVFYDTECGYDEWETDNVEVEV